MNAEDLAKEIASVSSMIEDVGSAGLLYVHTYDGSRKTGEHVNKGRRLEFLERGILHALNEYRAALIIELAEASGMRKDDERLALVEGDGAPT